MPTPPPTRPKIEVITAAVATASIGGLVGLTVSGVLSMLPKWAAVLLVVVELLMPMLVYLILKRAEPKR